MKVIVIGSSRDAHLLTGRRVVFEPPPGAYDAVIVGAIPSDDGKRITLELDFAGIEQRTVAHMVSCGFKSLDTYLAPIEGKSAVSPKSKGPRDKWGKLK